MKDAGKVERIFSILCKNLNKSIDKKLRVFINGSNLTGNLCSTSPRTHKFGEILLKFCLRNSGLAFMQVLLHW